MDRLAAVASALVAPGKGILAAAESAAALSARLAAAGVTPSGETRRACRELLVTTPGLAGGISGVILRADTLRQRVSGGRPFPEALAAAGLLTGITVDAGRWPLPGAPGETVTEGLDGLLPRLREYAALGAAFARWRAVLRIGPGLPSALAVRANAQALARYAAACQEAGLVPVAAVRVAMDGDHSLAQCESVTSLVLLAVMAELGEYGAGLAAVVLTPDMVVSGSASWQRPAPAEVAEATMAALGSLPLALAGVAFGCGGQPPGLATERLAALQQLPSLWPLTFSFGRALTDPALAAWRGEPACWEAGQRALARRVALNVAALSGRYSPGLELDPA